MGIIYDAIPTEAVYAKDIYIDNKSPMLFVSEHDDVLCYTGVLFKEKQYDLEMLPYYFEGKHSTHKTVIANVKRFFRISLGCIMLDTFIDNNEYYADKKFKCSECFLKLPRGASTEYGVFSNYDTEETEMTRAVFGMT
ncbi:hypothetical protein SDC9_132649 [bioreactor metagenome]|uniref:Uncharacterized protein n=1 Tax=bioreactor metagenome TaxID=1076179 RepID=A0A645D942_9ZZZZ